jgi:hypothetical protein
MADGNILAGAPQHRCDLGGDLVIIDTQLRRNSQPVLAGLAGLREGGDRNDVRTVPGVSPPAADSRRRSCLTARAHR